MIRNGHLQHVLFSLLVFVGFAGPLRAQTPASTFDDLRSTLRLKTNETVEIFETTGVKRKVKIESVTDKSIFFTEQGIRGELAESQVLQIRHKKPEKWWNGMLIGLGAGVATTVVAVNRTCGSDGECDFYATAVFLPVFAGLGMGIGAAADRVISSHETVFVQPNSQGRTVRVSPILNKHNAGVNVSFRF